MKGASRRYRGMTARLRGIHVVVEVAVLTVIAAGLFIYITSNVESMSHFGGHAAVYAIAGSTPDSVSTFIVTSPVKATVGVCRVDIVYAPVSGGKEITNYRNFSSSVRCLRFSSDNEPVPVRRGILGVRSDYLVAYPLGAGETLVAGNVWSEKLDNCSVRIIVNSVAGLVVDGREDAVRIRGGYASRLVGVAGESSNEQYVVTWPSSSSTYTLRVNVTLRDPDGNVIDKYSREYLMDCWGGDGAMLRVSIVRDVYKVDLRSS